MKTGSFASLHVRTSRLSICDIELSLVRLRQQWINFLRFEEVCVFTIRQKNKIVAFYEGDIDRKQLSRSLVKYVPNFMVPNVFVQVDAMPLTKNGKIDRKELTARYQEGR